MELRSAKAAGLDFPYTSATTCYIEVAADGTVSQGAGAEAYSRAKAGASRLFAVWPGQYRSDLFAVDDLDEYARATGLLHDPERTGLVEHVHEVSWESDSYGSDSPRSPYMTIRLRLECGCAIRDLAVFAAHMRQQRGWDIATSGGWGSSGPPGGPATYTLRVRRKSLTDPPATTIARQD
jgi:hypothetical protein